MEQTVTCPYCGKGLTISVVAEEVIDAHLRAEGFTDQISLERKEGGSELEIKEIQIGDILECPHCARDLNISGKVLNIDCTLWVEDDRNPIAFERKKGGAELEIKGIISINSGKVNKRKTSVCIGL